MFKKNKTIEFGIAVCSASRHANIDWRTICVELEGVDNPKSPIDSYLDNIESVARIAYLPEVREDLEGLRILMLGGVSAVEHYFRSVLAGLIPICGVSRRVAAQQMLQLGALDYYGNADVGYAIFEHDSFTSLENIRESTKRVVRGVTFNEGTDVWVSIDVYEKLCQLRHASIHAWGRLGTGNVQKMKVDFKRPVHVSPDMHKFQEMILACHNTVRAYNSHLFNQVVNIWVENGSVSGDWQKDRENFSKLFFHFYSYKDSVVDDNPKLAYESVVLRMPV